jgi:hypothetical protein
LGQVVVLPPGRTISVQLELVEDEDDDMFVVLEHRKKDVKQQAK